ncbi:MAG: hypothetical protein H6Q21_634 [Bacteroidetes bacterium]|jgi:uncharacterized protein|nr:hypothetical protein [Bacteroidota bacterium]
MRHFKVFIPLLFAVSVVLGQDIPEPMVPARLVNDFTGLLKEDQQNSLESKLVAFDDSTSTQITVVTYDDLQGYSIAEFASTLGTKWGIGQSGRNNGILILISPANRQMTIQTGYGLEGAVPDAICKRIIEKEMAPAFRENNYFKGIDDATNTLMALTKGEYTADEYLKKTGDNGNFIPLVVMFVIFFVILSSVLSRKRLYSPGQTIPWWVLMSMMGSSGHASKGKYGDFKSGSGGFGGFSGGSSGGGFGGFGGGSFGGGGASGGW